MATAVVVGEKPPDAEASAQGDSHGTKRGRQASKKKVAKKALVLPTPMPPIGQKAFICEGTSCDLVRRVLTHWGWTEILCPTNDRQENKLLKWSLRCQRTFRSRDAEKSVLEPWQLINHFHGSYYLSNKAFLGQCLQSCSCCSSFFPRQYDLRDAFGMRCFLRDYVLTAAEQVLRSPAAKIPTSGGISPREVALRVLRRYKEWSKGHADHPERLLRCPHEIAALLGHGCLLPRKISVHQRIHVDVFLSRSMRSECPVCQEDPKPQSGDSHPLQQRYLDGPQNIWALKEPCVQKGKGVTILSGLAPLLEDYEQHRATGQGRDCVAQKYIERPLLVNQPHGPAKCDLRVWVLDSMEPNAHKTNCRDTENRVPMKVLFESVGHGAAERWKTRTWPRLLDAVRLDESWQPWLLEINTSPCMLDDCKGEYEEEIKAWAWEATELFEEEVGRAEHSPCLGRMVRSVSPCLASGLSLEGPCGRWCLILREKVLDEMSLRQAHEALQRRIFQGVSARETSVSKLLREWLLPSEEEPISQEPPSASRAFAV
eukprot:g26268.t1